MDIKQPLFTRTTRVTETDEGIQQANISVYLYDDIDVAYLYFKDFMTDDQWDKQIKNGEGFYEVQGNGYTNTLFLETRKV